MRPRPHVDEHQLAVARIFVQNCLALRALTNMLVRELDPRRTRVAAFAPEAFEHNLMRLSCGPFDPVRRFMAQIDEDVPALLVLVRSDFPIVPAGFCRADILPLAEDARPESKREMVISPQRVEKQRGARVPNRQREETGAAEEKHRLVFGVVNMEVDWRDKLSHDTPFRNSVR